MRLATPRSKSRTNISSSPAYGSVKNSSNASSPSKFSTTSTSHLSPWRIKVMVEAERTNDDDETHNMSTTSRYTQPRMFATTIKVPLKGGDDTLISEDTLNLNNEDMQEPENTMEFLQTLTTNTKPSSKASITRKATPHRPNLSSRIASPKKSKSGDNSTMGTRPSTTNTTTRKGTPGRKRRLSNVVDDARSATQQGTGSPTKKRGRGRPRKSLLADESVIVLDTPGPAKVTEQSVFDNNIDGQENTPLKRGRGRPRKTPMKLLANSKSTLQESSKNRQNQLQLDAHENSPLIDTDAIADVLEDSVIASEGFSMIAPNSSILSSFSTHQRSCHSMLSSAREDDEAEAEGDNAVLSSTRPEKNSPRDLVKDKVRTFDFVDDDNDRNDEDNFNLSIAYPKLPYTSSTSHEAMTPRTRRRSLKESLVEFATSAVSYPRLPTLKDATKFLEKSPIKARGLLSLLQPADSYIVPGTYDETTHFEPICPSSEHSAANMHFLEKEGPQSHLYKDRIIVPSTEEDNENAENSDVDILPEDLLHAPSMEVAKEERYAKSHAKATESDDAELMDRRFDFRERSVHWDPKLPEDSYTANKEKEVECQNVQEITPGSPQLENQTTEAQLPQASERTHKKSNQKAIPIHEDNDERLLEGITITEPYRPNVRLLPNGKRKPLVVPVEWQAAHWSLLTDILYPASTNLPRRADSMAPLHHNEPARQAMDERRDILNSFQRDTSGCLVLSESESAAIDEFEEIIRRQIVGKRKLPGETRREWGFSRGQMREALVILKVGRERRRRWVLKAGESVQEWGL